MRDDAPWAMLVLFGVIVGVLFYAILQVLTPVVSALGYLLN